MTTNNITRTRRMLEGAYIAGLALSALARLITPDNPSAGRTNLSKLLHGHTVAGVRYADAVEAALITLGVYPDVAVADSLALDDDCASYSYADREIALLRARRLAGVRDKIVARRVYTHPDLPSAWVVADPDGGLWIVAVAVAGPVSAYLGCHDDLSPVDTVVARLAVTNLRVDVTSLVDDQA